MRNVIKKACAVVMMTAILFTAVAPTPVFATCPHPHPPKTRVVNEVYYASATHRVNGKDCTIQIYKVYKAAYCADCGTIFNTYVSGTKEKHSIAH